MRGSPRVSVITPTYNRAELLPETIESVLAQGFEDIEYIVVDDGSTDDTAAVLRRYAGLIKVISQDNQGEPAATNRGWREARGDYIAIVSSDDPMLPGWLETSIAFMDAHPDIIVGYPDWWLIGPDGRRERLITTHDYDRERLVGWFVTIPGPGTLIRRSATLGQTVLRDRRFRMTSDLECWLRLSLVGPFARIPACLATWRRHGGSISEQACTVPQALEFVRLARHFHRRRDLPPSLRALRRETLSRACWYASFKLREAHPLRSALLLRHSYRLSPKGPPDLPPILNRLPRPSLRKVAALLSPRRLLTGMPGSPRPAEQRRGEL